MDTSFSDSSAEFEENNANHVKKRKKTGTLREIIETSNVKRGSDWRCKRHKCFDVIRPEERNRIIKDFNNLGEYNRQNEYLGD